MTIRRQYTLKECKQNEFKCHNGVCLPLAVRCDNIYQCNDRSDEYGCDRTTTTTTPRSMQYLYTKNVL